MTQVLIDVIGVHAVATKNAPLTVGMVGVPVRFSFSPEWEELECLAVFRAGEVKKDNVLIDGCSVIPAEVMTQVGQTVYIGVEGRSRDGSIVFPTVWAEAGRILDGARASGDPALAPTPSQFDRLMGEMKRVDTTLRQTWGKLFPYGESEEILPAMTAAVSAKEAELPKIQILPGETYLVSFNGEDYTIVAEEEENTQRIGKISEGVPFSIYNSQAKPNGTWLQVAKNLAEVNVALWRRGAPAETIDPELLPAYGTGSGGTVTQEQIDTAVAAYLENHPLPKGLSDEQITALDGMFRVAAYGKEDVSQAYEAFKNAFGISGEEEPEAPHSHSYTSSVTKAATCTAAGVRTYTCSCGHSYTASIPATGHKWNAGVITVAPTEEKEGVRTYTCTLCGETYTESIAALDHAHKYASVVIAPTCTQQGYTEHTCPCGDSYKDTYISATGHTYADGVCTVCGAADPDYTPDEPDVPVEPEVTLTGISATYSGGNVPVGTAVSALTGIVVTANYSDGSSKAVTGYTLSGTIAEGSNTITVSYNGKTTTFTVTGVAESDSTDWTANEAYTNYNWIDGKMINRSNGAEGTFATHSASGYMPCAGASTLTISQKIEYAVFYDSNRAYISNFYCNADAEVEVPENAAWFRFSGDTGTIKTVTIIPDKEKADNEGAGTGWTDGVAYSDLGWTDGCFIKGNGATQNYSGFSATDFMPCAGASTIDFTRTKTGNLQYNAFYDSAQTMIEGGNFVLTGTLTTITVPENAAFFRISESTEYKDGVVVVPHG